MSFMRIRKSLGKYVRAAAPAGVDLILEIRLEIDPQPPLIDFVIVDPKTLVALWTFNQGSQAWSRDLPGRKNFSQAMSTLVGNVKRLTSWPSP
jgi:hypothetical protein